MSYFCTPPPPAKDSYNSFIIIYLYSYSRYTGRVTTLKAYYDCSYKYFSLFHKFRHIMTSHRAGFEPAHRGHTCSSARRSNHSATGLRNGHIKKFLKNIYKKLFLKYQANARFPLPCFSFMNAIFGGGRRKKVGNPIRGCLQGMGCPKYLRTEKGVQSHLETGSH